MDVSINTKEIFLEGKRVDWKHTITISVSGIRSLVVEHVGRGDVKEVLIICYGRFINAYVKKYKKGMTLWIKQDN